MPPVIVIGVGGHARVIADALLAAGREVLGFTTAAADTGAYGALLGGLSILGTDDVLTRHRPDYVVLANGIGGTDCGGLRRKVQERLEAEGWHFAEVRHPSAVVSPFSAIGKGSQLLAACVVQAGARIGAGCIVNTGAIVEHDAVLDDYVHVAPRALVCGDVRVGAGSHLGAGSVVRQGLRLGARTLVGAGATVVKDFEGGGTLIGSPARCGD